jgi:nitrogen fixation NifU-like protein
MNKADPDVGTGLVGAPACGDVMKLQIKVADDGTIEKAVFKTFGCGSAIASSSYATEILEGKKIEEAMHIKNTDIAQHLKLPPVKLHCSMLAEDAIKAAVTDYKKKKGTALDCRAAALGGSVTDRRTSRRHVLVLGREATLLPKRAKNDDASCPCPTQLHTTRSRWVGEGRSATKSATAPRRSSLGPDLTWRPWTCLCLCLWQRPPKRRPCLRAVHSHCRCSSLEARASHWAGAAPLEPTDYRNSG